MKARSVVFSHTQWPLSIYGLPPLMTALSVAAGAVAFVLAVIAGAVPVAMIAMGVVTIACLIKTYRLGRTDLHIETVFLTTLNFWGASSRRWLLTGAFPRRSRGGRS